MLVALVGVLALLIPPAASAQTAGHVDLPDTMPGDRILVSHQTAEEVALHTINWDASDRTVLTSGAADSAGTWSPDGRHVAFHRAESPADGVYVVASDGATAPRFLDRGHSPSWSPDSARVVYSPSLEGNAVPLRIATLDGSSTAIPGTAGGINPAWSPDGTAIAYIQPQNGELVVVRPDGSGRRVLATNARSLEWSPDSTQVAFATSVIVDGRDVARLRLVPRNSAQPRVLAEFSHLSQVAFSPSGRDLAVSARQPGGTFDVYRVSVADGGVQQLTSSADDDFKPAWTASPFTVAFTRTPDGSDEHAPHDVWHVFFPSSPARQITDTGTDGMEEFAPGLTMRLGGIDRVRTAVELSRTFPQATDVVIARADDYADALAGGPLAGTLDSPVLLTGREKLHPVVAAELARLGTDHAYVLGGYSALSSQIDEDLADAGVGTVTRLDGATRFHTAAKIAEELRSLVGAPDRVFIVEGVSVDPARGWPDAVSAGGLGSLTSEPILPVSRDRLHEQTIAALESLAPRRALIVGGPQAVSEAVEARLADHVGEVERVAGADRYETSAKVADLAAAAGAEAGHPWLTTGRNWPDALTAAPATALDGGVLLLVDGHNPVGSPKVHTWLMGHDDRGVVVGGPAAITPGVRAAIEGSLPPAH